MIIKDILSRYVNSAAMEKIFLMDRMRTIGASEIGQCARRIHYVKVVGASALNPDHKDNWGARVRGSFMEEKFWLPAMRHAFRKKLLIAGKDQRTVSDKFLSATPDGLVTDIPRDFLARLGVPDIGPSNCILAECKSIDPRVNLTEAKQEHILQTQTQLGLVRELTRYKPEYALVSYIDASFWDEVDEFVVKYDPEVYKKMHDRAVKIKTAGSPQDLQPEGWIAGGKECEHCPYSKACGIARRSVPEMELAADTQFVAEMTDLCREHEILNDQKKKLEAKLNEKKDEIKNRLRAKSVRKLPGVVSWSPVKGRTSYDMDRLKGDAAAAGLAVEDYATVGDPTDQLRVTLSGAPVV